MFGGGLRIQENSILRMENRTPSLLRRTGRMVVIVTKYGSLCKRGIFAEIRDAKFVQNA